MAAAGWCSGWYLVRTALQGLPAYANQESGFQMSLRLHYRMLGVTAPWDGGGNVVVPGLVAAVLGLMSPPPPGLTLSRPEPRSPVSTLGNSDITNTHHVISR